MDEFEGYYQVKSEPSAVNWSGFASAPDYHSLRSHFNVLINDPDVYLFFLRDAETHRLMGYAQLTRENDSSVQYSGFSLLREFQNSGMSRRLCTLVLEKVIELGAQKITGWISEKNFVSVRLLQAFGMQPTGETKVVRLPALQREDVYHQYEKLL